MFIGYKKNGNGYVEVDVFVDGNGDPILDDETILTPPPPPKAGFTMTINNGVWSYVIKSTGGNSLALARSEARASFERWKARYIDAPIAFREMVFHNDEEARNRVVGAVFGYREFNRLPVGWAAMGGKVVSPLNPEFLLDLASTLDSSFQQRFFESKAVEAGLESIYDPNELANFVFPPIPTYDSLNDQILRDKQGGVYIPKTPKIVRVEFPLKPLTVEAQGFTGRELGDDEHYRVSLTAVSPGLPDGNDDYYRGLKRIVGPVTKDTEVIYNLDSISRYFEKFETVCITHLVTEENEDFIDSSVAREFIKGSNIDVMLSKGESLWVGVVLGQALDKDNTEISDLSNVTFGSGIFRINIIEKK